MKFVSVRDFRNHSSQIWEQLKKEREVILTLNGHPNALLIPLSDDTMESTLRSVRQARAIEAVRHLQVNAQPLSMEEIDAEIAAARRECHNA